jgi:prevent-host-death family protein
MIRLNVHEAKTHLSKYLEKVEKGETIVLCRRNQPIAEIRPLPAKRKKPRPMGLDRGKITIPRSFFDPLSDELLAYFDGER